MNQAMSLKAKIRNIAKVTNIPAQVILQNFMFERFLVRLAKSDYIDKFILKGGMLVASIVGLNNRATMDLDTTLRNLPLTQEAIVNALQQIITISVDDGVTFKIQKFSQIRKDDVYGGFQVMLEAYYDTLRTPMSIDVTTGDVITPSPVQHEFHGLFDDDLTYTLWTYNIETIMAEKAETILSRGVFTTRPRDYYDFYILATTQNFDRSQFFGALNATALHRGTSQQIADIPMIIRNIEESSDLKNMWEKYRRKFSYAKEIEYEQIITAIKKVFEPIQ